MDVSKVVMKNKKKKCKEINKIHEEKLSNTSNNAKNIHKTEPSSFVTKKVKKKRKTNIVTNETNNRFSKSKLCERPNLLSCHSSSLLSKKLVKNIDCKVSSTPETKITKFNSKKRKSLKKRWKCLSSDNQSISSQHSDKIINSKRIKPIKLSQKSNSAKIHSKLRDINIQIHYKNKSKSENTSVLSYDMSEESETTCDKFNRYKNQNNDENSTDKDLKLRDKNEYVLPDNMSEESGDSCDEFNQYENLNDIEDDTDEDLEIRKELKSLNVYKEIKKLCKDNPMLFSNFNVTSECDLVEMEETEQPLISDMNVSNKLIKGSKGLSKTSEEYSKSLPNTSKTSDKRIKKCCENNVQTDQQENMLQRDYPNKSGKMNCSSNLKNKAQEKLQAAKFRFLNEKLYTESGKESFAYFQKNNDEFLDYHTGYNLQVLKWPMNPVNKIISSLQRLNKNLVIADMGCGDAKIAQTLTHCVVHSYDLVALNEHVTPCNISKVPLSSDTVDIVVFCLSLMGTNLKEYLLEAFRILKYCGVLKIAEVESRIPNLDKLIKSIESLGFTLENKDIQHKLFVFLDFKKDKKRKKMQDVVLNPCLYKKR